MKQFNKISDEELAAYLDNMLPYNDSSKIEAEMDIDTLEVLNVSRKAISEFESNNIITLPFGYDIAAAPIMPLDNPFAIAGFLGESNVADCDIDDSNEIEPDDNKE